MEKRTRVMLIGLPLAAIGFAVAGFVFGHLQSQPAIAEAERRVEEARSEQAEADRAAEARAGRLRAQLEAAREALTARQARLSLLEARRELAIAIDDLDQRNFGLAQTHVDTAAERLAEPEAPSEELVRLRGAVAAYDLEVSANLQTTRNTLRDFASDLDAMLASELASLPPAPDTDEPGTDSGTSSTENATEAPTSNEEAHEQEGDAPHPALPVESTE